MTNTRQEKIHRNFTHNEYDAQELGQPVGLICLSDEMCLMICSFCNVKEFNEMFSLINHIKSCHGSTTNSKIFSKFANEIKEGRVNENIEDSQGVSLSSETHKNSIVDSPFCLSEPFEAESSKKCRLSKIEEVFALRQATNKSLQLVISLLKTNNEVGKEEIFCKMLCSELKQLKLIETYDNVTEEFFSIIRNTKKEEREKLAMLSHESKQIVPKIPRYSNSSTEGIPYKFSSSSSLSLKPTLLHSNSVDKIKTTSPHQFTLNTTTLSTINIQEDASAQCKPQAQNVQMLPVEAMSDEEAINDMLQQALQDIF